MRGKLLTELEVDEIERHRRKRLMLRTHEGQRAAAALQSAGYSPQPLENGAMIIEQPAAIERPEQIASLLVQAGAPPTHLVVEQEDLEDYFLRLVGMNGDGR